MVSNYSYALQRGDTSIDVAALRKTFYEMEGYRDSLQEAVADALEAFERARDAVEGLDPTKSVESTARVAVYENRDVCGLALEEAQAAFEEWLGEFTVEMEEAESLLDEVGKDHATLISADDSSLEDMARDMAESLHGSTAFDSWPFTCIDWEQAGKELSSDLTSFEYAGESYYGR